MSSGKVLILESGAVLENPPDPTPEPLPIPPTSSGESPSEELVKRLNFIESKLKELETDKVQVNAAPAANITINDQEEESVAVEESAEEPSQEPAQEVIVEAEPPEPPKREETPAPNARNMIRLLLFGRR